MANALGRPWSAPSVLTLRRCDVLKLCRQRFAFRHDERGEHSHRRCSLIHSLMHATRIDDPGFTGTVDSRWQSLLFQREFAFDDASNQLTGVGMLSLTSPR